MTCKIISSMFLYATLLGVNAYSVEIPRDKMFHLAVSAGVTALSEDPVTGFLLINALGVFKEYIIDDKPDNYDILANAIGSGFVLVVRKTF